MAEYTYEDIIIDPTKEGIKSLIGKEVYFCNNPSLCLAGANKKSTVSLGVLVEIHKDSITPFVVERNDTDLAYSCIIVKKEEEPKYVPFESVEEFIRRYTEVNKRVESGSINDNLLQRGIWLRYKKDGDLLMVEALSKESVYISCMSANTTFGELLDDFEFIDGSPCGKESKDV